MPELENFGGRAGTLKADIPVSLKDGKTLGKYPSGSLIAAVGKTPEQVLRDLASESIYPGYQPAGVGLSQSVPTLGEVGEHVTNVLQADFYRNDGGRCTATRLYGEGQLLASSVTSQCRAVVAVVRTLDGTHYQAQSDYEAGVIKLVAPAGTPDDRAPLVGQSNAPQAAQHGLASNVVSVLGCYRYFWGSVAVVPTGSAQVRSLASSYLSLARPGQCLLDTGTANHLFVVVVPAGVELQSVVDLTALGAVLTGEYHPQPISVEDAAGASVPSTMYVMRAAVAYGESHQHQLVFSA